MSAALVAGKVSVTSKCVRGTGRVACDARASIRHPRASRFTSAITMPTSPHRSRDAAWRALRDPELTASRHLRPSRTHRSTRKVQSSKSRCVERPLPSFPASARARSPPLRDATSATRPEAGYPTDVAGRIARRDRRAPRCVRGGTTRHATVRVVRGRAGGPTRRPLPALVRPERVPSANKTTAFFLVKKSGGFGTRTRQDGPSRLTFEPFISRPRFCDEPPQVLHRVPRRGRDLHAQARPPGARRHPRGRKGGWQGCRRRGSPRHGEG